MLIHFLWSSKLNCKVMELPVCISYFSTRLGFWLEFPFCPPRIISSVLLKQQNIIFTNLHYLKSHRGSKLSLNVAFRNNNQYILQYPRKDLFTRILIYACPKAWNNTGDIIYYNNRTTFNIALKDKLVFEAEDGHINENRL
jgi:hypothetical protein